MYSEEYNCKLTMKNCRYFKLMRLFKKRSDNHPLGFILKHEDCTLTRFGYNFTRDTDVDISSEISSRILPTIRFVLRFARAYSATLSQFHSSNSTRIEDEQGNKT